MFLRRIVPIVALSAVALMGCESGSASASKDDTEEEKDDDEKSEKADDDDESDEDGDEEAKKDDEPSEEKKADDGASSDVAAMLVGAPPESVKLIKGHSSPTYAWAIKYPAGWAASQAMFMRRKADAAVLCEPTYNPETLAKGFYVTPGLIKALAKNAPVKAKNLEAVGEEERLKLGKLGTEVRAGKMKGNLFGADGGELYWWDVRFKTKSDMTNEVEPWHVYCIAALKAGAPADAKEQLTAVARSFEPPAKGTTMEPKAPPG